MQVRQAFLDNLWTIPLIELSATSHGSSAQTVADSAGLLVHRSLGRARPWIELTISGLRAIPIARGQTCCQTASMGSSKFCGRDMLLHPRARRSSTDGSYYRDAPVYLRKKLLLSGRFSELNSDVRLLTGRCNPRYSRVFSLRVPLLLR